MPKVITQETFPKAWATFKPDEMLTGLKDEASRMVKIMDEWMVTSEKFSDPKQWKFYVDSGYIELVKKAKKYRKRIYNRNADLKDLALEIDNAAYEYSQTYDEALAIQVTNAKVKVSEIQEEQVVNCWRIAKIYGHLLTNCGVNFGMVFMEGEKEAFKEHEFDPEKY